MANKILILLIMVVMSACKDDSGCVNCNKRETPVPPKPPGPSIVDVLAPKEQAVRSVIAEYNIDGKILKIQNLGWCKTHPGHIGELKSGEKCLAIYDYTKVEYQGMTSYIYRQASERVPFQKLVNLLGISSRISTSSKKWDDALLEVKHLAITFTIERDVSLQDWKYQLESFYKLQTSRCRSSEHHKVALRNHPLKIGNRLLNSDRIFYFDNVFNTVTAIEIDLTKSNIVGYPLLLDSYKSVDENDWSDFTVFDGKNNEITSYESDKMDDENPVKILNLQWFYTNCGIYYNSVNTKIKARQNPSMAFFPTYNSKYDAQISEEVDRVLEVMEKAPYKESTDYKSLLTRAEVDRFIPAKENLSTEALQFLLKDGYEVYSLEQFKRGY